jgi:hypothetical protein
VLNIGFGLIGLGVVLFTLTFITFGVVGFGSFGLAVKNMTDQSKNFDEQFAAHGKAMGGMASSGLILVIGGSFGFLSLASGILTVIYSYLA